MATESANSETLLENHINNLIQHFYVVGLDTKTAFQSSIYLDQHIHLIPTVISKFPNVTLPYLQIQDDIVASHCFPKGIQVLKENVLKEIFVFSLDNPSPSKKSLIQTKKVYFSCFLFNESLNNYAYFVKNFNSEIAEKQIFSKFIPKVICVCSFIPLHTEYLRILEKLRGYIISGIPMTLPIEKVIENLVFGIPAVPRGITKVKYLSYDGTNYFFEQTKNNELPFPHLNLSFFFNNFKIEEVFQMIKCLLLEIPLVIFCENKFFLSNIVEGLVTLIYPFSYSFPVIAIMPKVNYPLLRTLKCFVVGFNAKYTSTFFEDNRIELGSKNCVIVSMSGNKYNDIKITVKNQNDDQPIIQLKKNQPLTYNKSCDLFKDIELPSHYTEKTIRRIRDFLNKNASQKGNLNTLCYEFKECFNYYFVSILLDYQDYIIKKENVTQDLYDNYLLGKLTIEDLLDTKEYFKTLPKLDHPFYKEFFGTRMFKRFIERKVFPVSIRDKIDVLLFDESVNQKVSKKIFQKKVDTNFLTTEIFNYTEYSIACPKEDSFTQEEEEFLSSVAGTQRANAYFQSVTKPEGKFKFSYKIFPKLMNDGVFFSSISKPFENIKNVNQSKYFDLEEKIGESFFKGISDSNEIYVKKHYDINRVKDFDESNSYDYCLLLWIGFVTRMFYSMETVEKARYLDQITALMDTDQNIPHRFYDNLFCSTLKYGTLEMAIEMFAKVPNKNYMTFLAIRDKITKEQNLPAPPLEKLRAINPEKSSKNEIVFYSQWNCETPQCKNVLDVNNLIKFNKDTKEEQICCESCKKTFDAKIDVLIKNKATSKEVLMKFKLFSPFYLMNLLEGFSNVTIREFYAAHSDEFWSCVYYFSTGNYPTDFLFPYELEKVKLKEDLAVSESCKPELGIYGEEEGVELSSTENFFEMKLPVERSNYQTFTNRSQIKGATCFPILRSGTDKASHENKKKGDNKEIKDFIESFNSEMTLPSKKRNSML